MEEFSSLGRKEKFNLLRKWDIEYYEMDNPSVPDETYDACVREYNEKYKKKYVSALGNSSSIFEKHEHPYPVLSLDKETEKEGLAERAKMFGRIVMAQPKLDGLTVVYYPDGKLVSRGDGHVGEVLPFASRVPDLPKPYTHPVRMEAVILKKDYEERFKGSSKNARNLAAGILRRKDYTRDLDCIHFYAYDILGRNDLDEAEKLKILEGLGFETPRSYIVCLEGTDPFKDFENWFKDEEFFIDGAVIKAMGKGTLAKYGSTAHHPNNAFAFKFVSKTAKTVLRSVEWSEGRGRLTPVAIFDPVRLNGSTVMRASLHNMNVIKKLDARIGSEITVTLKNEIIPQIVGSDGKGSEIVPPVYCPCCGKPLKASESSEIVCGNQKCLMRFKSSLRRIASREGLDIRGLSEETIAKILETNEMANPFEILEDPYVKLKKAGLGDNQALLLSARIEAAKKDASLASFLYSCSIKHIGLGAAKDISERFADIGDLVRNWEAEGKKIDGIGEKAFLAVKSNLCYIESCARFISSFRKAVKDKKAGKGTIVITGKLSSPKARLKEEIEARGYGYAESVTRDTAYLVAQDVSGNSAKLAKARANGIKIITEKELHELLEENL